MEKCSHSAARYYVHHTGHRHTAENIIELKFNVHGTVAASRLNKKMLKTNLKPNVQPSVRDFCLSLGSNRVLLRIMTQNTCKSSMNVLE